jgi:5,10-methylenetetrahydromethanopterin reductase
MKQLSIAFQTDKRASEYVSLAQFVNQYNFDMVTVYCDAPFHMSFMPIMLMAQYLEHAKVSISAIPVSRVHPMDIASQAALLSDIARNGITIGFGRGAWLDQHSITELKPAIQAVRESIEVVQYFLSGRSDGYQGQVFNIADGVRATYPLPERPISILVGTWGEKLCAVAGEVAHEVKVGGSANPDIIPVIQHYISVGEKLVQRTEGSVGVVMGAVSVIDENRELARQMAKRSVALYLPVVAPLDPTVTVEPELVARLKTLADQHEYEQAGLLISDELLEKFAFAGNPEDFIRQANALFAAGASRIEFGTPHGIQDPRVGIQLLGEKVIPALRYMWR